MKRLTPRSSRISKTSKTRTSNKRSKKACLPFKRWRLNITQIWKKTEPSSSKKFPRCTSNPQSYSTSRKSKTGLLDRRNMLRLTKCSRKYSNLRRRNKRSTSK